MSQINNKRRNQTIRRAAAAFLVLAAGVAAWLVFTAGDRTLEVQSAVLETGNIASVMTITSEIIPGSIQETSVGSQLVRAVLVKVGDQVEKGDTLVTFDLTEFKDQLQAAQDLRSQTEEAADKVTALITSQAEISDEALNDLQYQINKLSAGLAGTTAALGKLGAASPAELVIQEGLADLIAEKLAEINPQSPDAAEQIQDLLDTLAAGIEISANPEYQALLQSLQQNINKMSSALTGLLSGVGSEGGLIDALAGSSQASQLASMAESAQNARAQAIQAEALAKRALENAVEKIVAETDGVVAEVNAIAGEYTGSGASELNSSLSGLLNSTSGLSSQDLAASRTPVVVVYNNSHPRASFRANRYDAARLAVGMPVVYQQDDRTWTGFITYKGRIAVNSSLSGDDSTGGLLDSVSSAGGLASEPVIDLEMSILGENPADLTLGFNLDAEIQTAAAENVLLLPAEAMKKELDEYFVYVIGSDSRLARRRIVPGIQSDRYAEVKEGLSAGEKVVLNPPNSLAEGQLVKEKTNE